MWPWLIPNNFETNDPHKEGLKGHNTDEDFRITFQEILDKTSFTHTEYKVESDGYMLSMFRL